MYKRQELQLFIQRFSANKAKAKQATARRKLLDKLTAVSYTHLDVYKRQAETRGCNCAVLP